MNGLASYFAMGGYAGYVWTAWGLAALVSFALLLFSWRELRARQNELKLLQEQNPGRRGRVWGGPGA